MEQSNLNITSTNIVTGKIGNLVINQTTTQDCQHTNDTGAQNLTNAPMQDEHVEEPAEDNQTTPEHVKKESNTSLSRYFRGSSRRGNQRNQQESELQGIPDSRNKELRKNILRGRSTSLLSMLKYNEASKLLEELDDLENYENFDTSLMLVECYLHVGREEEAGNCINRIEQLLMSPLAQNVHEIVAFATDLISSCSYTRSIVLLWIASKIYLASSSSPDALAHSIDTCVYKTRHAVCELVDTRRNRSRMIALNYGVKYMVEMFDGLCAVKNAEMTNKVITQAQVLNDIALAFRKLGKKQESIDKWLHGISMMEKQFSKNAGSYKLYGNMLGNIANTYCDIPKYPDAKAYFVRAKVAFEQALDFRSESDKIRQIEKVKNASEKLAEDEL